MSGAQRIITIQPGTQPWCDLLDAAAAASFKRDKITLSLDFNGRGEPMLAVKVGESVWSPHWPVEHRTINRDEEINECEGHESLDGAHMGEAVYCDGSCRAARNA